MIEFFKHYIHPTSPTRSKLAVHLNAQTPQKEAGTSTVSEKVENVLGLNKSHVDAEDGEVVKVEAAGNGTTPYIITDVREFKSKLQVSSGPQPVKHISEFEELDAKL